MLLSRRPFNSIATRMGFSGRTRVHSEEVSEEEHVAAVVDGGDQSPFLLGVGGPKLERGITLNESDDGGGHHFPRVGKRLAAMRQIAVEGLGTASDGGDRDRHAWLSQATPEGSLVVARARQARFLNEVLLPQEVALDEGFGRRREPGRHRMPIGNGETFRVASILLEQFEKAAAAHSQNLLDLRRLGSPFQIGIKQEGDLLV